MTIARNAPFFNAIYGIMEAGCTINVDPTAKKTSQLWDAAIARFKSFSINDCPNDMVSGFKYPPQEQTGAGSPFLIRLSVSFKETMALHDMQRTRVVFPWSSITLSSGKPDC